MALEKTIESDSFDAAMNVILRADPAIVKAAVETEKREREAERKAKRSSAVPASSSRDI